MAVGIVRTSLEQAVARYRLRLRAENKAAGTVRTYMQALKHFAIFLHDHGMPEAIETIRREHVEAFIVQQLDTCKPSTAASRYRVLKTFFRWLVDEDEIVQSPMRNTKTPRIPELLPPHIPPDALTRLLAACTGRFGVRDRAVILLFVDTGLRRAELASIQVSDLDLAERLVKVMGKGRRERMTPFTKITASVIGLYLNGREQGALWIGHKGPLDGHGIASMLAARCKQAGLERINPHRFRHTFARQMLGLGMTDSHLMALAGWRQHSSLVRYTRATAAEQAIEAYRRLT